MENLNIIGYYNSRNSDRWYVTEDKQWKVRINTDGDCTAINGSTEVYRVVSDTVYDTRSKVQLSGNSILYDNIMTVVGNAYAADDSL